MERAFAEAGLDWRYLTLEVSPEDLGDAVRGFRAMGFRGGNFTIPHKVTVLRYLDALSEAARIIKNQFSNEEIEIRGHTDNVPIRYSNYKSNWELSAARALSVLHYMIEQEGLSPKRLHAAGYGKTRPVASNDTSEGRSKNRRAEILIRTSDVSVTER